MAEEMTSSAYRTSSSEEEEEEAVRPVPKKAKFAGASKYKTRFSSEWKKTWPFVASVGMSTSFVAMFAQRV